MYMNAANKISTSKYGLDSQHYVPVERLFPNFTLLYFSNYDNSAYLLVQC